MENMTIEEIGLDSGSKLEGEIVKWLLLFFIQLIII